MIDRFHQFFFGLSVAIVAIAILWGFWIAGSPLAERARKFDERRLEDLRIIHSEIMNTVHAGQSFEERRRSLVRPLPQTLEDVAQLATMQRVQIVDPETSVSYEYPIIDATRFELCAVFTFERNEPYDLRWNHPAGRHCFAFDALALEDQGPIKRLPDAPFMEREPVPDGVGV